MKLLVSPTSFGRPENAQAQALLSSFADEIVYNDLGVPLKGEELLKRLDGVDGYIAGVDYIDAETIEHMPDSIRVISRYGVGVDRVDIPACTRRGIKVTNTPGVNATAVCEMAFGLMLCVARNIPALHLAMEKGEWPRSTGMELSGKTLGIVGLGSIGKKLSVRAKAFEMRVLAYDPFLDNAFAVSNGIEPCDLNEILTQADVVSLHVPLTKETTHIIDANSIKRMKSGAIIINTARGGLIDEKAAAAALLSGKLRGLGLDAFEQEPIKDSPFTGLPGVVYSPHTGAHTTEAMSKMGILAVQNAIAVLGGEPCSYVLND